MKFRLNFEDLEYLRKNLHHTSEEIVDFEKNFEYFISDLEDVAQSSAFKSLLKDVENLHIVMKNLKDRTDVYEENMHNYIDELQDINEPLNGSDYEVDTKEVYDSIKKCSDMLGDVYELHMNGYEREYEEHLEEVKNYCRETEEILSYPLLSEDRKVEEKNLSRTEEYMDIVIFNNEIMEELNENINEIIEEIEDMNNSLFMIESTLEDMEDLEKEFSSSIWDFVVLDTMK